MHRLYVVAFPEMGADDAAKVEALRAAHDSAGHALLRAHFTFVFGCVGVSVEAAERVMQAVACEMSSIEFCLTGAVTLVHSDLHYVFLCPEQGASAMIELHAKLHAGPLAACIDPTQAFTPHLTVCKTADPPRSRTGPRSSHARWVAGHGSIARLESGCAAGWKV